MTEDTKTTTPRREGLLPWMSSAGLALLLLGVIAISNGARTGLFFGVVGAVLFVGGLIRRSIDRANRR